MAKWNLETLNECERACLGHLEQAKKGVFAQTSNIVPFFI